MSPDDANKIIRGSEHTIINQYRFLLCPKIIKVLESATVQKDNLPDSVADLVQLKSRKFTSFKNPVCENIKELIGATPFDVLVQPDEDFVWFHNIISPSHFLNMLREAQAQGKRYFYVYLLRGNTSGQSFGLCNPKTVQLPKEDPNLEGHRLVKLHVHGIPNDWGANFHSRKLGASLAKAVKESNVSEPHKNYSTFQNVTGAAEDAGVKDGDIPLTICKGQWRFGNKGDFKLRRLRFSPFTLYVLRPDVPPQPELCVVQDPPDKVVDRQRKGLTKIGASPSTKATSQQRATRDNKKDTAPRPETTEGGETGKMAVTAEASQTLASSESESKGAKRKPDQQESNKKKRGRTASHDTHSRKETKEDEEMADSSHEEPNNSIESGSDDSQIRTDDEDEEIAGSSPEELNNSKESHGDDSQKPKYRQVAKKKEDEDKARSSLQNPNNPKRCSGNRSRQSQGGNQAKKDDIEEASEKLPDTIESKAKGSSDSWSVQGANIMDIVNGIKDAENVKAWRYLESILDHKLQSRDEVLLFVFVHGIQCMFRLLSRSEAHIRVIAWKVIQGFQRFCDEDQPIVLEMQNIFKHLVDAIVDCESEQLFYVVVGIIQSLLSSPHHSIPILNRVQLVSALMTMLEEHEKNTWADAEVYLVCIRLLDALFRANSKEGDLKKMFIEKNGPTKLFSVANRFAHSKIRDEFSQMFNRLLG